LKLTPLKGTGSGKLVAFGKSVRLLPVMLLLTLGFLFNALTLRSPFIGVMVAVAYLALGGYSVRNVFRKGQGSASWALGILLLLILVGTMSWAFTVSYKLESLEVFLVLVVASFLVWIIGRFTRGSEAVPQASGTSVAGPLRMLEMMYGASIFFLFLLLLQSRTLVPMTVWNTLNPLVVPVFFLSLVLLIVILNSGEKWQISLALVIAQSIVAHVFFVFVFDAGYGVDQWAALGWTRRLFDSSYYPEGVLFNLNLDLPGRSFVYQFFKSIGVAFQPTLSTVLARLFSVDVYWVHMVLVPLLWGIFAPVIAYHLTETITEKKSLALVASVLTLAAPSLILWGSVSVPNSLGFLMFFFDFLLLADYLSSDRSILWTFVIVSATVLAHMLPGIIAFAFMIIAFVFKNSFRFKWRRVRMLLLISVVAAGFAFLPIALMMGGISYPALVGAQFTFDRLKGLSPFNAAMLLLVGGYGDLTLKESAIRGLLPLLGLLGLVYINLSASFVRNKMLARFSFLVFALVMVDSRIVEAFLVNVPFSASRVWVLGDLLSIPFAAIFMARFADHLLRNVMAGTSQSVISGYRRVLGNLSVTLLVLGLSALITMSLTLGYTVTNSPSSAQNAYLTASELDAARFINSIAEERYVVVSYTFFKLAGYAVVGTSNPGAYYSMLYDYGWMDQLFNEVNHGSALGMYDATLVNNASLAFYVTSRARFPNDVDQVIQALQERPDFRLEAVFQDDVYVFSYRPPVQRMVEGIGPSVNVLGSSQSVNTTYVRDMVSYETTYRLNLTGSTDYRITGWSASWSFEAVTPQPAIASIDANQWINFTATPGVIYAVQWTSNYLYSDVGWSDDSFLTGWNLRYMSGLSQDPVIERNGDVLSLTSQFRRDVRQVYWLQKSVRVSSDLYPYAIVRWRSTGTCAISWGYYTDGSGDSLVFYGSESEEWSTSIVRLTAGKTVSSIMVGLDDFTSDTSGQQSAYFDYVLLARLAAS
jgi:hypothetical protein